MVTVCEKSLMVEWLEQASQWHEMYCHDLEVMSSNPGRVELGVHSKSALSCTWTKLNRYCNYYWRQGGHFYWCLSVCLSVSVLATLCLLRKLGDDARNNRWKNSATSVHKGRWRYLTGSQCALSSLLQSSKPWSLLNNTSLGLLTHRHYFYSSYLFQLTCLFSHKH